MRTPLEILKDALPTLEDAAQDAWEEYNASKDSLHKVGAECAAEANSELAAEARELLFAHGLVTTQKLP